MSLQFIPEKNLGHSRRIYILRIYLSSLVTYTPAPKAVDVYSLTYCEKGHSEQFLLSLPVHLFKVEGSINTAVQSILKMGEQILNSLN